VLVAERAAQSWGVLSLEELRACGLSRKAVWVRVRAGRLHPLHRGVYAVGHPNVALEGRFAAAVKACGPRALLSHHSAAALWGILAWETRFPQVTVAGGGTRLHPGLRVYRSSTLGPRDVVRHRGIAVTSAARTLVDLAAGLTATALRRAVARSLALGLTNVVWLVDALHRAGRRRGAVKLAAILARGPAPTRSELEDVVLELIGRGGLEPPQVNVALRLDGRRVVPDFRWARQRLVLEADGAAWHDNPIARADDAERQALLEAHGERVLRATWRQAVEKPTETLARLRAAGAPLTIRDAGTEAARRGNRAPARTARTTRSRARPRGGG
jgi:very-short-patch-repair endonuclease